jgi:hypothetical protein
MALTRIAVPTPTAPATIADYQALLAEWTAALLQSLRGNTIANIDSATIRAGVVVHVAGVLYKAVTDQAIGGTPSKYVKITPSGATAACDFVASLAGVSWLDAQSGYYDGSNNLYIFDEARAVVDGVIATPKTIEGLRAYIANSLSVKGSVSASAGFVDGFLGYRVPKQLLSSAQRNVITGAITGNSMYDMLATYLPVSSTFILAMFGVFLRSSDNARIILLYANRLDSDTIRVTGFNLDSFNSVTQDMNDGDGTSLGVMSASW